MISKNIIRLVLTVVGVIGVPITSWLSVKCSKKAETETTTSGKVKSYIPAIVSGAVTTASIIATHRISSKEIAALATTASFVAANRDKLEQAMNAYDSGKQITTVKEQVAHDISKSRKGQSIEWTGKGKLKVLEGYSGRMFYSSLEAVQMAEQKLNRQFNEGDYICLNDFYHYLGIQETEFGRQFGWAPNDNWYPNWNEENALQFINTFVEDEDGYPMLLIDIQTKPMEYWEEV